MSASPISVHSAIGLVQPKQFAEFIIHVANIVAPEQALAVWGDTPRGVTQPGCG